MRWSGFDTKFLIAAVSTGNRRPALGLDPSTSPSASLGASAKRAGSRGRLSPGNRVQR
jgi:hypothetical protein